MVNVMSVLVKFRQLLTREGRRKTMQFTTIFCWETTMVLFISTKLPAMSLRINHWIVKRSICMCCMFSPAKSLTYISATPSKCFYQLKILNAIALWLKFGFTYLMLMTVHLNSLKMWVCVHKILYYFSGVWNFLSSFLFRL